MKKLLLFTIAGLAVLFLSGCAISNNSKKQSNSQNDLDVQAKCSSDAKGYFESNWQSNSSLDILLTYTNHYNKSFNKCFILVEYHFWLAQSTGLWDKNLLLYNVYENTKYAEFSQGHSANEQDLQNNLVTECNVQGKICKSEAEFTSLIQPYINN